MLFLISLGSNKENLLVNNYLICLECIFEEMHVLENYFVHGYVAMII